MQKIDRRQQIDRTHCPCCGAPTGAGTRCAYCEVPYPWTQVDPIRDYSAWLLTALRTGPQPSAQQFARQELLSQCQCNIAQAASFSQFQ